MIYRETWGDNTLIFGYDENGAPYSVNYNGTTCYYVLNQQGDVVRIVDASGETQASYTYDAWGSLIASTGTASGIGAVNPLLYRGYYYDAELGMYYLQSRYYDPVVRRFVNTDTTEILENYSQFNNILYLNNFSYGLNNPVNCFDNNGKLAGRIIVNISINLIGYFATLICRYGIKNFKKHISLREIAIGILSATLSALLPSYFKWLDRNTVTAVAYAGKFLGHAVVIGLKGAFTYILYRKQKIIRIRKRA